MCTLISRGDLLTSGNGNSGGGQGGGGAPHSNKPATPANQTGLDDDMFAGIDLKPAKLEVKSTNNIIFSLKYKYF